MSDPFFREIVAALEQRDFGYNQFEECVCDLLRTAFPGIVPIRGGADAGMDGAIPDDGGPPMPVVITTAANIIGNLSRNLTQYVNRGGTARRAVLATSRELTPHRRRNLEDRASALGFVLSQTLDRRDLADFLYRNPRWTRNLLGLSGQPSALSQVPMSRRPPLHLNLVGRDVDMEWLCTGEGDRLLLGEPGCGKTALLLKFVQESDALFLSSENEAAIANALRALRPKIVIVDDAHKNIPDIERLRRLRTEIDAHFAIVATTWTWPRYIDQALDALGGLPESRVHRLRLLTRNEIVEVVKQVGIRGPNELLRLLVDQASNKPGLAVTLAALCLQGDFDSVLRGRALSRTLLNIFREQVGPDATALLACLAVGGDGGMSLEAVRSYLGLPLSTVTETASALAASGVLTQRGESELSVEPEALRAGLLRDEVLTGPARLDHRRLLDLAADRRKSVEALVEGVVFGGQMAESELKMLVADHGTARAWRNLGSLDEDTARWVLDHCPLAVSDIAGPALHHVPRLAVRRLLESATFGEDDDALAVLKDWTQNIELGQEEAVERRRILAEEAAGYLHRGGEDGVGFKAILLSLSLRMEGHRRDPGRGTTVTLSWGRLSGIWIERTAAIWDEVREAVLNLDVLLWRNIRQLLRRWLDPDFLLSRQPVTEVERDAMRVFAVRVLRDVASRAQGRPGLTSAFAQVAEKLGVDLNLEVDEEFEALYPSPSADPLHSSGERAQMEGRVQEIALGWVGKEPTDAAERFRFFEEEARTIDRYSPRMIAVLAQEISRLTDKPRAWADALIDGGLASDLVIPFFRTLVDEAAPGWEDLGGRLLTIASYATATAELLLLLPELPSTLLEKSLEVVGTDVSLVENLCWRNDLRKEVHLRLLRHKTPEAAVGAAIGTWNAARTAAIAPELRVAWREAILRAGSQENGVGELVALPSYEYSLGRILASDSDLAFDWITERLKGEDLPSYLAEDGPFQHAVGALDPAQRAMILELVSVDRCPRGLISLLVERQSSVYQRLLQRGDLGDSHVVPLQGLPEGSWWDMARQAAQAGYAPSVIAEATFSSSFVIITSGHGVDGLRAHEAAFAARLDSTDPVVAEIARSGRELAQSRLREAEAQQLHDELHGL